MPYIGADAQGIIASINGGTISNATLDSSVTFPAGTIQKWEQVTTVPSATQGADLSYTDVTGSSKNYTPAVGSSYVVDEYLTTIQGNGSAATFLSLFKLI